MPIVTIHDLDQGLANDIEGFRRALGEPGEDFAAVIDPASRCAWWISDAELQRRLPDGPAAWKAPTSLEEGLLHAMMRMQPV